MEALYLSQSKIDKLHAICGEYSNDASELINILHAAQGTLGYLPPEVQEVIASKLDIPVSKVYGVVSFYSFFTMTPNGKYPISICMGTACYVKGAEKILEELERQLDIKVGETTSDGLFSLDCLRCIGACGLAPVISIAGKVFGRMAPEKVKKILSEYYFQEK
ncbi:MAG: NAD(P)H-dependent oxidoreductase subunit E [Tannerellaceae bacterium]|jgi:NADH-quinone oxidoreductase subunit E/NADP-reducing hydrogenase subunit HndA|nr:NAD(P)H-dependent oxidoreductase subunit E [Tannerellaceae bacterium]